MTQNFTVLSLTVFTQRNFAADLQAKCDFRGKTVALRFEPPLWDLEVTNNDQLRLIEKGVVDFPVELFSLDVTAEAISLQRCRFDPKF